MDSGASIPCVSRTWLVENKIQIIQVRSTTIGGVTPGVIQTNEYALIYISPLLQPNLTIELRMVVLPTDKYWLCHAPKPPRPLYKYAPYMADPEIPYPSKLPFHSFPILVGGAHMNFFRMTAVYFNKSFAIQETIAGLVPRGYWPPDVPEEQLYEFKREYDFYSTICPDEHQYLVQNDDVQNALDFEHCYWTPNTLVKDQELNAEIQANIRSDRAELQGALAVEIKKSVQEQYQEYLKLIQIENIRIILPLPKSKGFPHKVRSNHAYGKIHGLYTQ
jgi:hypothetical protein